MSIRVQCQKCGSSHSLNQRLLGRTIRCPICDASIDVPTDSPTFQDADVEQEVITVGEVDSDLVEADLVDAGAQGIEAIDADMVESESVDLESDSVVEKKNGEDGVLPSGSTIEHPFEADEEEEIGFAKRELPKDDMDMTPMVDVTFLLLIFFMITASFTSEKVLEEPPPLSDRASTNARDEPEKIQDTVRVEVDEFNAYTIILPGGEDRQATSKQDLLIALEDARKELVTGANDNALKVAIEAHTDSIHAAVVAAIDSAREKGFSNIQVTVVEEFD